MRVDAEPSAPAGSEPSPRRCALAASDLSLEPVGAVEPGATLAPDGSPVPVFWHGSGVWAGFLRWSSARGDARAETAFPFSHPSASVEWAKLETSSPREVTFEGSEA